MKQFFKLEKIRNPQISCFMKMSNKYKISNNHAKKI